MLRELTIEGEIDKVKISLDRLKMYEPEEGYYLAYSGGKDSTVILDLAKKAGVKYDAWYNHTTVDPPELVRFIKSHKEVNIDYPDITMWRLIEKQGVPPTRLMRYCCKDLKERGGEGRRVITGVRWEESTKRQNRRSVERCFQGYDKLYVNPIIDWTSEDVWQYIRENNLEYCHLYDEGYTRLGCVMCPFSGKQGMIKDSKRWPKYYQAYIRAFDRMIKRRKEKGLKCDGWETAEKVMYWWVHQPKKGNPDQTVLFE